MRTMDHINVPGEIESERRQQEIEQARERERKREEERIIEKEKKKKAERSRRRRKESARKEGNGTNLKNNNSKQSKDQNGKTNTNIKNKEHSTNYLRNVLAKKKRSDDQLKIQKNDIRIKDEFDKKMSTDEEEEYEIDFYDLSRKGIEHLVLKSRNKGFIFSEIFQKVLLYQHFHFKYAFLVI